MSKRLLVKGKVWGRAGGKRGGRARAAALTAEQRQEIARKGGKAAQALLTYEERSRRSKLIWERLRAKGRRRVTRASGG
jgi:general stress protein YciG